MINSSTRPFGPAGEVLDTKVGDQLATLGGQVAAFALGSLLSVS